MSKKLLKAVTLASVAVALPLTAAAPAHADGPVPGDGTTISVGSKTSVTVLGPNGVVCVDYYLLLPSTACVGEY